MFLAVGMDGNGKSFVVFGALTLNETAATYTWVFETAKKLLGTMACTAVHYIVSDDDHGEKSALMRKVCIRGRSACGFICAELHNISHNCKKKKIILAQTAFPNAYISTCVWHSNKNMLGRLAGKLEDCDLTLLREKLRELRFKVVPPPFFFPSCYHVVLPFSLRLSAHSCFVSPVFSC